MKKLITFIIGVLLLTVLVCCDNYSNSFYRTEIVTYDTAQFRIVNDTIAIHKSTGNIYEKTHSGLYYMKLN